MEFGARGQEIQELVAALERGLGIEMREHDDSESGVSYHWSPDEFLAINIEPTRVIDPETGELELGWKHWKRYDVVIGVSDELEAHISRIRYLIQQGLLQAEELPPLPPLP